MAKGKTKNPYLAFRFDIQDSVLCPVPLLGPTDFPSLARSILLISTDAQPVVESLDIKLVSDTLYFFL